MKKNSYIPSLFTTSYDLAQMDVVDILKYQKLARMNKFILTFLVVLFIICILLLKFKGHQDIYVVIPILLLFSTKLIFYTHRNWSIPFVLYLITSFLLKFILDYFGEFSIGTLKFVGSMYLQPMNYSLIAAFLWVLLNYGVGIIVKNAIDKQNIILKSFIGALVLISFCFWIDNFALQHHFLLTSIYKLPIERSYSLFFISFITQYLFHKTESGVENNVAVAFLILIFCSLMIL